MPTQFSSLLLVMAGAAIGGGFRYHVGRVALTLLGPGFPWGTWLVNLLGGFLMGTLAGALARWPSAEGEQLRLFLGVGVLGGFTTFSSFSLEAFNMIARGENLFAAAYAVSSVVGSLLALLLGVWLMRLVA
jgi:CrcB protein